MTTPIKRVEKRWKSDGDYGPGVTLSCGHFFRGEHEFRSRARVACPICPDRNYAAANRMWPIWMLSLAQEAAAAE